MQTDAERTLGNLHVLGALSHNDKLMTNDDVFDIYAPTSLRGLIRTFYGERRATNITRVKQTVRAGCAFAGGAHDDAMALLRSFGDGDGDERLRLRFDRQAVHHLRMCEALTRAKAGLAHLVLTYRDDSASTAAVCLLMTEIDDFFCVMEPHTRRVREELERSAGHAGTPGSARLLVCEDSPLGRSEPSQHATLRFDAVAAPSPH